jgi:3-oxoacyl-[acyl-carrier-protein] synthase-3
MPVATLERIESFVPQRSVPIADLADSLGLTPSKLKMFQRMYGLDRTHIAQEPDLFELVLPAARQALATVDDLAQVRQVIFAHTIQQVTPAHLDPARVIRDELGLRHADAFALTQQNCASGLAAIDVAAELLRAEGNPDSRTLVVTGERAFSPIVQLITNTAIMGEAAAACVVAIDGDGDTVDSYVTRTLGEFAAGVLLDAEGVQEFGRRYPGVLAEVIRAALDQAGLRLEDVELVIPHNVNMPSWLGVIKELGTEHRDRFFLDNIRHFSHCYASDVFLNYTTLREAGRLVDGGRYLLTSVGLGATFAAMTITHQGR